MLFWLKAKIALTRFVSSKTLVWVRLFWLVSLGYTFVFSRAARGEEFARILTFPTPAVDVVIVAPPGGACAARLDKWPVTPTTMTTILLGAAVRIAASARRVRIRLLGHWMFSRFNSIGACIHVLCATTSCLNAQ